MSLRQLVLERIAELEGEVGQLGGTAAEDASVSEQLRADLPLRRSYLRRCAQEMRRLLVQAGEDITAVERGPRRG